jgi:CheY-like chemotaxis protein
LLIDDDPDFTRMFRETLVAAHPGAWIVHVANSYAPALTCLEENKVDVVVLDLDLPIMDGLQFLPLLKRQHPDLQVIVLTASAVPENRARCLENGANLFLDKAEFITGIEGIYAAIEAVTSAPAEGFRGVLRQVGLGDILQLECLGRKSSLLEVSGLGTTGRIFIQEGSIIHAEAGEMGGEPALNYLLSLKGGDFQLKPFSMPARQTIDGQWESLMMEAARLSDEASGGMAPPGQEPSPKEEIPCQVEEIVLCSTTGELLYEWQAKLMEQRIQQLARLEQISQALSTLLHWQRGERLEVEAAEERLILVFQLDGRALIRTISPRPQPTLVRADEGWLGVALATRGVLACGILQREDSVLVETNREDLPKERIAQAILKLPEVLHLLRDGQVPIQRLCWKFASNHIYCAISPEGSLTTVFVNYDLVKSAEIERLMGERVDATPQWEPQIAGIASQDVMQGYASA